MGFGRLEHNSVSLDHIRPFSRGGEHSISNLRFVCYLVNMMKRDISDADFISILGVGGVARLRAFIES